MGYAGQVSFGQAAFLHRRLHGGHFNNPYDWGTVPALLAALVLPALVAAVIGKPTLKLKEHYLALATLAVGLLIHILLTKAGNLPAALPA